MAFVNTSSYTWVDGEIVTAAKLNTAGVPTIAAGQSYAFADGAAATPSLSFNSEATLGFYRQAATWIGASGNIRQINATSNSQLQIGQDTTHNINFLWTYNATAGSATAVFGTFGKTNDLTLQANTLNFDSASLAFAVQIVPAGRVRVGGGSDDGVNAFQVAGATASDRYVAIPTTLTYAGSTAIDFTAATVQTITLTGNITFTTSNLGAGRAKKLRIIATGGPWTMTIPSWNNLNGSVPASIAAGKTGELNLFSWGTTDAAVNASYAVTS